MLPVFSLLLQFFLEHADNVGLEQSPSASQAISIFLDVQQRQLDLGHLPSLRAEENQSFHQLLVLLRSFEIKGLKRGAPVTTNKEPKTTRRPGNCLVSTTLDKIADNRFSVSHDILHGLVSASLAEGVLDAAELTTFKLEFAVDVKLAFELGLASLESANGFGHLHSADVLNLTSEHALVKSKCLAVSTDCVSDLLSKIGINHQLLSALGELASDDHVHQRIEVLLLEDTELNEAFLAISADDVEVALLRGTLAFLVFSGDKFNAVICRALAEVNLAEEDLAVFLFNASFKVSTNELVQCFAEEFNLGLRCVRLGLRSDLLGLFCSNGLGSSSDSSVLGSESVLDFGVLHSSFSFLKVF